MESMDLVSNTCRIITGDGAGSGFFVASGARARVVTNAHVVGGRSTVVVLWQCGDTEFQAVARLMAVDWVADLAVVDLEAGDFLVPGGLKIGSEPCRGESVMVAGFPAPFRYCQVFPAVVSGDEYIAHGNSVRRATL